MFEITAFALGTLSLIALGLLFITPFDKIMFEKEKIPPLMLVLGSVYTTTITFSALHYTNKKLQESVWKNQLGLLKSEKVYGVFYTCLKNLSGQIKNSSEITAPEEWKKIEREGSLLALSETNDKNLHKNLEDLFSINLEKYNNELNKLEITFYKFLIQPELGAKLKHPNNVNLSRIDRPDSKRFMTDLMLDKTKFQTPYMTLEESDIEIIRNDFKIKHKKDLEEFLSFKSKLVSDIEKLLISVGNYVKKPFA